MTELADTVLPLIRTRADLHRWHAANAHGAQMHEAVDILEAAMDTEDPEVVLDVAQRAIASATTLVMRADDSSGIIGDACRRLIELHPRAAGAALPPTARLVRWMIRFQFEQECDFFTLDPVAYAPALGDTGIAAYRRELGRIRDSLGPRPEPARRWGSQHSHEWFTLEHVEQRLAVHDRDVEAVIRTHARDQAVPAWLEDTARALEEIGETDAAIDWAHRAADHSTGGHQAIHAAAYWCELLAEHRPAESLTARHEVFRRWPTSMHAAALKTAAGRDWSTHRDDVLSVLSERPREAVQFALSTLNDPALAWELAHRHALDGNDLWLRVARAYEEVDPRAVIPVYTRIVIERLEVTDPRAYRDAATLLVRMRRLSSGTAQSDDVDEFIADLRETHRRRPRLQKEFTRARLP